MVGCSSSCSGCPNRCQVHWLHAALSQLLCVCVASPLFPLMPVAMGRLSLSSPLYIKKRLRGGWKIENLYFKPKKRETRGVVCRETFTSCRFTDTHSNFPPLHGQRCQLQKTRARTFWIQKQEKKWLFFKKANKLNFFFCFFCVCCFLNEPWRV